MAMRWKKWKPETGLASVGAGKYRASDYHDGKETFATVYPSGGNWRSPLRGWYFVSDAGGQYENTSNRLAGSEDEAKAQAVEWVKAVLAKVPA